MPRQRAPRRPSPRRLAGDSANRVFLWIGALVCTIAAYSGYARDFDPLVGVVVIAVVVIVVLYGVRWFRLAVRRERREWSAHAEASRQTRIRSLSAVDALTGAEFEQHVAELCRRDGCLDVEVSGGAGDLGADVVGALPDGRKLVIQCKRYAPSRSVGSPDMQRFVGTARPVHEADVAVLVASCRFTAPARDLAHDQDIVTVDRELLGQWMAGTGLAAILLVDAADRHVRTRVDTRANTQAEPRVGRAGRAGTRFARRASR
ncbi:restriction endonuclease [Streptomyces sp. SID3343]|nr:restriction endonuclease [Streptomyces sp. SID3343]